ncbi:DUF3908 family protein [Paenibacillus sp. FSL H7-0714]|uniref:DUF3908 family protein n=1 Tax=Paenibacillus sp. FSL H7-0714 TaxID=2954735 RepID=UPI0030F4DD22
MNSYKEFIKSFGHPVTSRYSKLFSTIKNYVNDDEVKAFYPKNFFNDNKEKEFYAFTDKNIFVFRESDMVVTILYFKEVRVEKLQLVQPYNRSEDLQFEVRLDSDDKFNFDSMKDSNHDWAYQYVDYIKAIYKLLK